MTLFLKALPSLPRLASRIVLFIPAIALLFAACGDNVPPAAPLAIIVVTPNPNAVPAGTTQQFIVSGQDALGNVVAIPGTPTWSVVAGGGTISESGMFTAGESAGTFANTVQASSGEISGFASVSVTTGALATIIITPTPVSMTTGAIVQFLATGRDASGNIVSLSPTWSVVNGGGTINGASGVFTAGASAGAFAQTIKVTSGSVSGLATITVVAPAGAGVLTSITIEHNPASLTINGVEQFTATGQDANGVVVPISLAITWSVVNGGGSISSSSGLFTAGAAVGSYANTIQATSGGVSGFASVAVAPPVSGALATITIVANTGSMASGTTQQFTAVGHDASGNVVALSPTWSVVNGGGTINSSTGVFTAGTSAGTYAQTIKVRSGDVSTSASVTVVGTSGALTTITVASTSGSVQANGSQTFTATGRDANGVVVAISPAVTWTVTNGGGTISSTSGVFTAAATAGSFSNTIRATSGAVSGTASVTVVASAGALASMTTGPNPASVVANTTQQFTASGRDVNGNPVSIAPAPVWSVVNGGGTINSSTGLFTAGTATGVFSQTIKVTSGDVSSLTSVTVVAAPSVLTSITLTPNPGSMATHATQQFAASGKDANGVVVSIPPGAIWSVVNGGGSINSGSGLFTAGASTGSFSNTVRLTSGSVSGSATVTITSSSTSAGPSLGTAAAFAVLGSTAVSCTGVSNIAGDIGVAPAGAVTGFPSPCTISAPGRSTPHVNDAVALTAQADVTPAFNALAAMPCGTTLSGQDLGGMTLAPGVYCFTSSAQLTGNLTLAGPANGLWVFQVASALTTGTSSQVIMSGGGQAKNVFWQIGSSATIGQTTAFQGNIVAGVSITLVQGATLHGRALSKAGVTMDTNLITLP
jgi:hypothetical protein